MFDSSSVRKIRGLRGAAGALFVLLSALALAAGCSESTVKAHVAGTCSLNTDCDAELICTFGACHEACAGSKDCPIPGTRCVKSPDGNVCQLASEASCAGGAKCDPPLACAPDGQCRNACNTDRDCTGVQICAIGGYCAEPAEVGPDRRLTGAADAGLGRGGSSGSGGGGPGGAFGSGGTGAGGSAGTGGSEPDASIRVDAGTPESDASADACASGTCACPSGTSACGASCVDEKTDKTNCGVCGHKCFSGTCSGGLCQPWTVATVTGGASYLVSDGTSLLWIDGGTKSVVQKAATGAGSTLDISTPDQAPTALALANGVVVFVTGVASTSQLQIWTATEGTANSGFGGTVFGSASGFWVLYGLAIHPSGGTAYLEVDDFTTGSGSFQQCSLGLSGSCSLMRAATPSDLGDDVGATGNNLFYTVDASGSVERYGFADTKTADVATGQGGPYVLALDSSHVYFGNRGANSFLINRASQTNPTPSSPESVLVNTTGALNALATDGKYVYYAGLFGTTEVGYVPVGGGTGKPLYTGASGGKVGAHALVAAGGAVFFYDTGDKTIHGIAAPP